MCLADAVWGGFCHAYRRSETVSPTSDCTAAIDESYRRAMMLPGMHDLNDSDVNVVLSVINSDSPTSILCADEHIHMTQNVGCRVSPPIIDSSVSGPRLYRKVVQSTYNKQ